MRVYVENEAGRHTQEINAQGAAFESTDRPAGFLTDAELRRVEFLKLKRKPELLPDQVVDLELELDRGVVVTGRTLNAETGEPLAGIEVWANRDKYSPESIHPHTLSGGDGTYRLEGVSSQTRWHGDVKLLRLSVRAKGAGMENPKHDGVTIAAPGAGVCALALGVHCARNQGGPGHVD